MALHLTGCEQITPGRANILRRRAAVLARHGEGAYPSQIARDLGLSPHGVTGIIRRAGLVPNWRKRGRRPGTSQHPVRDAEIAGMRRMGATLKEIGDRYGLTRERVRQILKQYHSPELSGLKSRFHRGGFGYEAKPMPACRICGQPVQAKQARYCSPQCKAKRVGKNDWRYRRGYELRVSGKTWREVAEALGYNSPEVAHLAVDRWARKRGIDTAPLHGWRKTTRGVQPFGPYKAHQQATAA